MMQKLAFERGLKHGDITLMGNDGGKIKAFSNILMLSPYFEAAQGFREAENKTYEFDSLNTEQLIRVVKYLHGINPLKLNKHVLDLLDYFQIPLDSIDLTSDIIADITVEQIIRIFGDRELSSTQFTDICKKILAEGFHEDDVVMEWIRKKRKRGVQTAYFSPYRTILIAHNLSKKRYSDIIDVYEGHENGDIIKDLVDTFESSKLDPKYIAKFVIYLLEKYRSERKETSKETGDKIDYINGIIKDEGEKECFAIDSDEESH